PPAPALRPREARRGGARGAGAPEATVSLVFGQAAGSAVVDDPHIRAVGFTGSLGVGRMLHDRAALRPDPIPFYGELGALNALTVTPAAARERAEQIAEGLAGSFTL